MNRWLSRIASACAGLSAGMALHNATEDRLYYAGAWLIATVFAAMWWVAQRCLIAAQERWESAEAYAWSLKNAAIDVLVLTRHLEQAVPVTEVQEFASDVRTLLKPAQVQMPDLTEREERAQ